MARKYSVVLGPALLLAVVGTYHYYYRSHHHKDHGSSAAAAPLRTIVAYEDAPECEAEAASVVPQTEEEDWMRVDPSLDWYVYSAYLDRRTDTPLVRVLAMAGNRTGGQLFCWMWSGNGTSSVVRAQPRELWIRAWDSPEPGRYHCPFLISCPVPARNRDPASVAVIVGDPCTRPTHRIRLPTRSGASSDRFAVCLKPLRFQRDVGPRLLEWIELQFLLGADRVCAYVHRVHPRTRKVLEHYAGLGRLTLLDHSPPPGTDAGDLWQKRRHEMAIYNDCFYRHLDSHQFVVNIDLDEAIVPVARDSWPEMMDDYLTSRPPSASLSARCAYFFDSLGEDLSVPPHLHMLRHVYRSSEFAPPGFAQKSFFSTLHAEAVSNHFALRSVRRDVRLMSGLDLREARLHHYRKGCPDLMERDCDRKYMKFRRRDTLLWKYRDRLERNVLDRMQEMDTEEERKGRSNNPPRPPSKMR